MNIEDRVKKIVSHQFSKSLNLIQNNSSTNDELFSIRLRDLIN